MRGSGRQTQIRAPQDFANVMLRAAIIPATATATATETDAAGALIDRLAALALRADADGWLLHLLAPIGAGDTAGFGPIRLGPAPMVHLDPLNRRAFLTEWEKAMDQR